MINNNIQESYCSFEVSKLLKEKGFGVQTLRCYFEDGTFKKNLLRDRVGMDYGSEFTIEFSELIENWNDGFVTKKNGNRCFGCNGNKEYFVTYSAPTHALGIEWIRVNFNKIITIYANASGYCFEIHDSSELGGSHVYDSDITGPNESGCWDNFEDANEAALLYTLKHLIK